MSPFDKHAWECCAPCWGCNGTGAIKNAYVMPVSGSLLPAPPGPPMLRCRPCNGTGLCEYEWRTARRTARPQNCPKCGSRAIDWLSRNCKPRDVYFVSELRRGGAPIGKLTVRRKSCGSTA